MTQPSLKDLLDVAIEAARAAGKRTLDFFNLPIVVDTKHDNTPVTQADREAEQIITQIIQRHFPRHSIVGEEHGNIDGNPDYKWIIDPIDGTKAFIHGVPLYGVLVGVEVRGRPSAGAIYLPAMDELIAAADGLGCTWNTRPARVSTISSLSDATLLVTSAMTLTARSDAFENLASRAKLVRGWGDCYGYVLVATGRAEIMLDASINPWDCAPLVPILREAGGRFTNWQGEETIYGPDAVGTNAALHEQVIQLLRAEKRRTLK